MTETVLNALELAVLRKLLEGEHPVLAVLRSQIPFVSVTSREFTGHGFYTNLSVNIEMLQRGCANGDFPIDDVGADIVGLRHGAGFVLFVRGGYLKQLEGFCYGEKWPIEAAVSSLFYLGAAERDLGSLKLPSR